MLRTHFNNLGKRASLNPYLAGGALGTGLGALYGIGDSGHNYYNDPLHGSTGSRAAQGLLSGVAATAGYKGLRGLGGSGLSSSLAGLLSAAGAAALLNPSLKEDKPFKINFRG
jgi:hypothetical protein